MENKKWYMSKSLWVAFIVFVGSILAYAGVVNPLDLSPDAVWVGIAWSVIQTVLRAVTNQPVGK